MALINLKQIICYKNRANHIKNRVCSYHFDKLVKKKKAETKNILSIEEKYEDSWIYFTRYVHKKLN